MYDYDSLGRLIRQEIQTNDTFSHVGSTEVSYDVRNNVTKVAAEFNGYTAVDKYMYSSNSGNANASSYASDNLISRYYIANTTSRYVDYFYDDLNRLDNKTLAIGSVKINTDYVYKASDRGGKYTTTQVETEKLDNTTYKYYYDVVGNITSITKNSGAHRTYTYDKKNQLLSEVNNTTGVTTNFTYDAIGNITKKVQSSTSGTKTINYRYGNDGKSSWNNLLTGVDLSGNGAYESTETITYDNIGNPTTYLGASLSWYGRQLKSYNGTVDGKATNVTYTYNSDGLRGTKIHNGTKSTYHYVGGQLRYETRGNLKFYYFYDASGNLSAIRYYDANGKSYAYFALTNAQGDVVAFYTGAGVCVVTYEYDAWGNIVKQTDTTGINFAELNPIRYRGYYYDSETGLYYLQSRYYDPQVSRFISADSQLNNNISGLNTFSYCNNSPTNGVDPTGHAFMFVTAAVGAVIGAAIGGIATKSWKGALAGAAIGGLVGLGAGALASAALAGSATASTSAVIAGGKMLATIVGSGGATAGAAYIVNNLSQATNQLSSSASVVADKMKAVAEKGKAGEAMSGLIKNTTRIPSLTGTASYRIPDGLDTTTKVLSEVKNYSGVLSYTSQLKDFVMWSQANGYQMHLYTNATLSGPLQQAVDSGAIQLYPLG